MAFPGELNINYYKGDTHEFKIYPQKTDGSTFYLNDYNNATFTIAQARGTAGVALGQINASAKIQSDHVVCAITPENGKLMDPTKTYVYDVQVYSQGADTYDKVFTLITGSISVTDDVTQDIGTPNRALPTYRVIYHNTNATSGVVPVDTNEYLPTQNVMIAPNFTLARIGYELDGWTKFSDGTGTVYRIPNVLSFSGSDLNLYPKWLAIAPQPVYYVSPDGDTGASGGSQTYVVGTTIAEMPTTSPTRQGYAFAGWYTGPNGTGVQVSNNSYTPPRPYGPVVLQAKWTAV
jgi:hypothetical protein